MNLEKTTFGGDKGKTNEMKLRKELVEDLVLEERHSIEQFLESDKKTLLPYPKDLQEMFQSVIKLKNEILKIYQTKLADTENHSF